MVMLRYCLRANALAFESDVPHAAGMVLILILELLRRIGIRTLGDAKFEVKSSF